MSRIKQLAPSEIQKIAAGEVVERPANVVKELVENALDAGSSFITIIIEQSGKRLIRVIDNGSGMDAVDARLCFQPHATSKITSVDDLSSVHTFGFRGEALASIASVSVVELKTKLEEQATGTHIKLNQGVIEYEGECAQSTGTDISVANLFFNVPARKKFLKSDETELRAITAFFYATCLTHLSIHFKLIHDGRELYNCPPTDSYKKRASQLWDTYCSQHVLELPRTEKSHYVVEGIISNHVYGKYDRSSLFVFVNNRWVKNQKLISALIKGYSNVLPQGKYPCGALFISVPGIEVDINIHPRKEEVQFLHPRTIEQFVGQTVKSTLENGLSAALAIPVSLKSDFASRFDQGAKHDQFLFSQSQKDSPSYGYDKPASLSTINSSPLPMPYRSSIENGSLIQNARIAAAGLESIPSASNLRSEATHMPELDKQISSEITSEVPELILGQLNKTYILLERPDGLFIVDQHAAHERILYEKFSSKFESVSSVTLLFPHIINMSGPEIETVEPFFELFNQTGFVVDRFGPEQLIVHATPVHAKDIDITDLLKQVTSWIKEQSGLPIDLCRKYVNEKLHAQMACKAAVKAGDELSKEQMQQLITDLSRCENRLTCPHGRPTGWLVSTYDIEKKFKRVGN